jgi:ankyrin repeat protein
MHVQFHPNFLAPHSPEAEAPQAPAERRKFILYSGRIPMADFLVSEDFPRFKTEFTDLIDHIHAFADAHKSKVNPQLTQATLDQLKMDCETMKTHLFDQELNYFSVHKTDVYSTIKKYFHDFDDLLKNEKIPLQARVNTLTDLGKKMNMCAGGLLSELECAIGALRPDKGPRLMAAWLKDQLVTNSITEYVRQKHGRDYAPSYEVHIVNRFIQELAADYGVKPTKDPFINIGNFLATQSNVEACKKYVALRVKPLAVTNAMAEICLDEIKGQAFDMGVDPHAPIPARKLDELFIHLQNFKKSTLIPEFGGVDESTYLWPALNEHGEETFDYQIASNSALIAEALMDTLRDKKVIEFDKAVTLKAGENGDIMKLGDMFWRKKGGRCYEIKAKDWLAVSPADILSHAEIPEAERYTALQDIVQGIVDVSEKEGLQKEDIPEEWLQECISSFKKLSPGTPEGIVPVALLAATFDKAQALQAALTAGVDRDASSPAGETLLTIAAKNGCTDALNVLIKNRANTNAQTRKSLTTALMLSIRYNHPDAMLALVEGGANIEIKDYRGHTAIIFAVQYRNTVARQALIDKRANINAQNSQGLTPLMMSIQGGDTDAMHAFIADADIEIKDRRGHTALMLAAENGNVEMVKALIDKDAKIEEKNNDGMTALMFAAANGNVELVKALIDKGAKIEEKNKAGMTALMFAAANNSVGVVKALIDKGAKIKSVKSRSKENAVDIARRHGNHDLATILNESSFDWVRRLRYWRSSRAERRHGTQSPPAG